MTSRLKRNSGTQKEWITSSECSMKRIFSTFCGELDGITSTGISVEEPTVDTGVWPSDASVGLPLSVRYSNCQFHLKASTCTTTVCGSDFEFGVSLST